MTAGLDRWKSYLYPGTDVLRNKHDLRDPEALKAFEYEAAARRQQTLPPSPGRFDLAHLQEVHQHLFQDTYEWAGQLRDVEMAKGASTKFVAAADIAQRAKAIHQKLAERDFLRGRDKQSFVQGLAEYHAELNQLHPFREGNGRATRVLLADLAQRAGYVLDQRRIDNAKGQWNEASAASMHGGDLSGLRKFFADAVRPARSVALEELPREQALQLHPELKPLYERLDSLAKLIAIQHPGNARAQEHFVRHKRSEMVRLLDTGDTRGLDMSARDAQREPTQATKAADGPAADKLAASWRKVQDYASANISDPAARERFLAEFKAKIRAVQQAEAASARVTQHAPAPSDLDGPHRDEEPAQMVHERVRA